MGEGGKGEGGRGEASKKGGGEPELEVLIDSGKVGLSYLNCEHFNQKCIEPGHLVQNREDEVGQGEKC